MEKFKAQNPKDYLDTKEAAEYLTLAPSTLEKHRSIGGGPKFRKFGRSVRYTIEDLRAWADSRTCESTFDEAYASPGRRRSLLHSVKRIG